MKRCPHCAEEIQDAAIVCKHCKRDLGITSSVTSAPSTPAPASKSTGSRFAWLAVVAGLILTFASTATAGFGILAMWIGMGLGLKGSAITRWGGGFMLALIIGGIGISTGSSSSPSVGTSSGASAPTQSPAPTAQTPPAAPRQQLVLLSKKGYESDSGGYFYVEGQVKNVSDAPLENVTAVATWFTRAGKFITSDDALIDYNPLLPGQTSPFKTITRGNPEMAKFSVDFKTLFGRKLNVEDQSR